MDSPEYRTIPFNTERKFHYWFKTINQEGMNIAYFASHMNIQNVRKMIKNNTNKMLTVNKIINWHMQETPKQ